MKFIQTLSNDVKSSLITLCSINHDHITIMTMDMSSPITAALAIDDPLASDDASVNCDGDRLES